MPDEYTFFAVTLPHFFNVTYRQIQVLGEFSVEKDGGVGLRMMRMLFLNSSIPCQNADGVHPLNPFT